MYPHSFAHEIHYSNTIQNGLSKQEFFHQGRYLCWPFNIHIKGQIYTHTHTPLAQHHQHWWNAIHIYKQSQKIWVIIVLNSFNMLIMHKIEKINQSTVSRFPVTNKIVYCMFTSTTEKMCQFGSSFLPLHQQHKSPTYFLLTVENIRSSELNCL